MLEQALSISDTLGFGLVKALFLGYLGEACVIADVGAGFRRFADDHREASGERKRGEGRLPVDASGRIDRKATWPG